MKIPEGVEWAIHCCSILACLPENTLLSKSKLADFFDIPEHYLAKITQKLSRSGIISATRGGNGGYCLAKAAKDISLHDIFVSIDGESAFFQCTEIRQCGPTGVDKSQYPRPCGIARVMWRAESAWRDVLSQTSLADVQATGMEETPTKQIEKSIVWFEEALK